MDLDMEVTSNKRKVDDAAEDVRQVKVSDSVRDQPNCVRHARAGAVGACVDTLISYKCHCLPCVKVMKSLATWQAH